MNFGVMVILVTINRLQICILLLLILYVLVYFSGFLYERLIFKELFCEGPSDLRIYALTMVRVSKPCVLMSRRQVKQTTSEVTP